MLKSKKAQIDIALTIGAIVIPAAALIGSLIFAFALLGPLTDAARLAAVIAHDTVTLTDVAYSVPDDIKIYYKPPPMCQFIDTLNPNAGCNPSSINCGFVKTESNCSVLDGCKWHDSSCVDSCAYLNKDDCEAQGCTSYYSDGKFSSCGGDNTGIYQYCTGLNEQECKNYKDLGCFWEEPTSRLLSCLNGFMNISNFAIKKEGKETKTIYGNGLFVFYTKASLPARFPRDVLEEPLIVEYPGFANLKDYGYKDELKFKLEKGKVVIGKIRDGVYDTLDWVTPEFNKGPLYEIIQTAYSACWNGRDITKETINFPPMYYINASDNDICLKKVAQDPHNVTDDTQQEDIDIYCFNISELNSIERCEFIIDFGNSGSYNNRDSYPLYRSIKVIADVSCHSPNHCSCTNDVCEIDDQAQEPYFNVTITLEENS